MRNIIYRDLKFLITAASFPIGIAFFSAIILLDVLAPKEEKMFR